MGFNLWLVIFLALMPVFILFTGLSAAGGFQSSADWQVIGIVLAAAVVTGYLAKRRGDEISNETSIEAGLMKHVGIPVGESDPSTTLPTYLLHELHPSHFGYLNRDEVVAPALRLRFDGGEERKVIGSTITVPTTLLLANARSGTDTTRGSPAARSTTNSAAR